MILKIFSPKNSAKKMAFLTQNKGKICKILIITLVFEKNANFFAKKLAKIAENCDHNIDPSSRKRFFFRDLIELKSFSLTGVNYYMQDYNDRRMLTKYQVIRNYTTSEISPSAVSATTK
jgi:hypothetical protein